MNFLARRQPDSKESVGLRFLTLRETAVFLNLHPNTVRSQVRRGKLPGAKVGRGWRFLEADLIASIRSRYCNLSRGQAGVDRKAELWQTDAGQEFMLPASRHATELALDALLERPAIKG